MPGDRSATVPALRKAIGFEVNLLKYLWSTLKNLPKTWVLGVKLLREMTQLTVLGWWWLIVRAVMPTIALIAVMNFLLGDAQPTELPYGLFLIPGMMLFVPLQIGLQRGVRCMLHQRRVIDVFHFPKLNVALAALFMPGMYFVVFLLFSIGALGYYSFVHDYNFISFGWNLLLAPVMVVLSFVIILSIVCFTSVIMLMARDIRFAQPLAVQVLLIFSPIIYPVTNLPDTMQSIVLKANPLAPIVETLRWSLFGVGQLDLFHLLWAASFCLLFFLVGAWFLMRAEWIWEEVV